MSSMDSSMRRSFLDGTFAVPARELTAQDWEIYLHSAIKEFDLRHSSRFRSAQELLEARVKDAGGEHPLAPSFALEISALCSPKPGLTLGYKARCFMLDPRPQEKIRDLSKTWEQVFLTDKGILVLWKTEFCLVGARIHVRDNRYTWLGEGRFAQFIEDQYGKFPDRAHSWLRVIRLTLETDRDKAKKHLAARESSLSGFDQICNRVRW